MTNGRKIYWATVAVTYSGIGLAVAANAISNSAWNKGYQAGRKEIARLRQELFAERQRKAPITVPPGLSIVQEPFGTSRARLKAVPPVETDQSACA